MKSIKSWESWLLKITCKFPVGDILAVTKRKDYTCMRLFLYFNSDSRIRVFLQHFVAAKINEISRKQKRICWVCSWEVMKSAASLASLKAVNCLWVNGAMAHKNVTTMTCNTSYIQRSDDISFKEVLFKSQFSKGNKIKKKTEVIMESAAYVTSSSIDLSDIL